MVDGHSGSVGGLQLFGDASGGGRVEEDAMVRDVFLLTICSPGSTGGRSFERGDGARLEFGGHPRGCGSIDGGHLMVMGLIRGGNVGWHGPSAGASGRDGRTGKARDHGLTEGGGGNVGGEWVGVGVGVG